MNGNTTCPTEPVEAARDCVAALALSGLVQLGTAQHVESCSACHVAWRFQTFTKRQADSSSNSRRHLQPSSVALPLKQQARRPVQFRHFNYSDYLLQHLTRNLARSRCGNINCTLVRNQESWCNVEDVQKEPSPSALTLRKLVCCPNVEPSIPREQGVRVQSVWWCSPPPPHCA